MPIGEGRVSFSVWHISLIYKFLNLILLNQRSKKVHILLKFITGSPGDYVSLRILHMPNQMLYLGCFYSASISMTISFFKKQKSVIGAIIFNGRNTAKSSVINHSCEVRLKRKY